MCYPSPGPRCSAHARAEYVAANKAFREAFENGSGDELETAHSAASAAKEAWLKTPEGIKHLRANGMGDLADIYAKERAASIAAMKAQQSVAPGAEQANDDGLSPAQRKFFEGSQALGDDGNLAHVFHGSAREFAAFDPSTLGRGNDSWGNGFYFTDQEDVAHGYANESGSADANVKEFYLNMKNPIRIDGMEESGMDNQRFNRETATKILMRHPLIFMQPGEEDAEGNTNPLSDYAPEFWDKESHTRAEMETMVRKMGKDYFSDAGWTEMETTFGRENGAAFLEAVRAETGHDGVIVDFGKDEDGKPRGKHYIAWFADQMKMTSNADPT